MAFTLVQKSASVATGTGGTVTGTLPAGSAAGNTLVACLGGNTGSTQFAAGAGWVQAAQVGNGTLSRCEIWYYPSCPAGITTAAFTGGSGGLRAALAEFHSSIAGATVTVDNAGTGTASAVTACTATGTATAGDLIVAAFTEHLAASAAVTWTDPSGYTLLDSITASGQTPVYSAYKLSAAGGAVSVTGTSNQTAGTSGWTGCAVSFKEVAATGLSVATTSPMPGGQVGVAYSQTLTAAGGSPPDTWAITAGALPAGLSLISSGGRGGGFGATLRMSLPPVLNETAVTNWQALIGRPVTCQKWYTGGFPLTPDSVIQACIDLGMTCYLCYSPPFNPPTTAAFNSLQASLQAFKNAGLNGKVVLWQEIEDRGLTPAQYKAMIQFYEPAVHAVFPGGLVHDAAGSKHLLWASYFPATLGIDSLIDEYGIDFYANTYASGTRLGAYAALVAATGKRLGVMEMGSSIGNAVVPPDTGPGSVTEYFQHVTAIAAANPPGSFMWYTQDNLNVNNIISDPADFRIPLLQALSDAVAGASAAGQITGTPSAAGLASFTAQVTDNNAVTATAALTITIAAAAPPVITTAALPAATTGTPYSQQLTWTGGTAPLAWAVTAGALPDGLVLDPAAGLISGTPSALAATSGFTVTLTDATGRASSQALFITVVAGLPLPPSPASPRPGFPQVIIEAGLTAAAPQVPAGTFILDDPVYGKLGSGNQLADTTAWTDIAGLFIRGTISRPSTRVQGPLLTYQGGTATGTFDNTTGALDPDNPSSPYAGALRPMVPFAVRAVYGSVSYPMWAGFTGSWAGADLAYDMGYDEVTITADDGFKVLAGITIPAATGGGGSSGAGDGEDSGARVTRILNAASGYTDPRRVSAGDSVLQGTLWGDTALNLLQLTADSEIGELYMDGAGNVVFRHRHAVLTDARSATVQAVFGDAPGTVHGALTELACTPHRRAADDITLANDIQATSAGGTLQEAQSASSQRTYLFPRTYARSDLLLEDDPTTLAWAQWVLAVSLAGDDRFDAITIDPVADPDGLFPQVLGREIGDRIQVWRRPQNSGATIVQDCFIRGIQHDLDAVAGTWSTTWTLQSALRYTGFLILDDPATGL